MKEAGLQTDVEENGKSFAENADIKATAIQKLSPGDIVLADDSGLEIDALNGEPGIYSARYMGEDTSYRIKNANLIERLNGVPDEKRTARFVCAISAALPGGKILRSRGTIEGRIGYEERGANNTNYGTYRFWHELGAKRVVSARELSMKEIKEIRSNIPDDLEIETFVHGAMCISYSGRCLLSNYFTGRDANQGACTHPCRWKYAVMEESRPGEYLPVYENERGTYIFNSKDLCMIGHIPDLIDAGIDSFKIEGRMKTALYVATVARTYRKAIDDYLKDPVLYEKNMPWYLDQISNCTYRQFTTGFFYGKPDSEAQIYDSNTYVKEYTYLGIVGGSNAEGLYRIEQRNKFSVGETIEIMKPNGDNIKAKVLRIVNEEGGEQESAPHPKQVLYIDLGVPMEQYDILRRKEDA